MVTPSESLKVSQGSSLSLSKFLRVTLSDSLKVSQGKALSIKVSQRLSGSLSRKSLKVTQGSTVLS